MVWELLGLSTFEKVTNYFIDDIFYQAEKAISISHFAQTAIEILNDVPSICQCHDRYFKWSRPIFVLKDGTVVKTCKNIIGLHHIFLADNNGKLIYGAFITWSHEDKLKKAIDKIKRELT